MLQWISEPKSHFTSKIGSRLLHSTVTVQKLCRFKQDVVSVVPVTLCVINRDVPIQQFPVSVWCLCFGCLLIWSTELIPVLNLIICLPHCEEANVNHPLCTRKHQAQPKWISYFVIHVTKYASTNINLLNCYLLEKWNNENGSNILRKCICSRLILPHKERPAAGSLPMSKNKMQIFASMLCLMHDFLEFTIWAWAGSGECMIILYYNIKPKQPSVFLTKRADNTTAAIKLKS